MTDRKHPDYEDGYFDALEGRPTKSRQSETYDAGWKAGDFARSALQRAGFSQDGEASFSLKMTAPR